MDVLAARDLTLPIGDVDLGELAHGGMTDPCRAPAPCGADAVRVDRERAQARALEAEAHGRVMRETSTVEPRWSSVTSAGSSASKLARVQRSSMCCGRTRWTSWTSSTGTSRPSSGRCLGPTTRWVTALVAPSTTRLRSSPYAALWQPTVAPITNSAVSLTRRLLCATRCSPTTRADPHPLDRPPRHQSWHRRPEADQHA